jgi:hypothetical protein
LPQRSAGNAFHVGMASGKLNGVTRRNADGTPVRHRPHLFRSSLGTTRPNSRRPSTAAYVSVVDALSPTGSPGAGVPISGSQGSDLSFRVATPPRATPVMHSPTPPPRPTPPPPHHHPTPPPPPTPRVGWAWRGPFSNPPLFSLSFPFPYYYFYFSSPSYSLHLPLSFTLHTTLTTSLTLFLRRITINTYQ